MSKKVTEKSFPKLSKPAFLWLGSPQSNRICRFRDQIAFMAADSPSKTSIDSRGDCECVK